jgi:hypothetical protein
MCRWCAGCTTLNKILQFTTRLNCGFIAGGLIAAAIALTNHWALYTAGDSLAPVLRLNRWTGNIVACGGESKSNYFACFINAHSEKKSKFD